MASKHKRAHSDPPPITVSDHSTARPAPSPEAPTDDSALDPENLRGRRANTWGRRRKTSPVEWQVKESLNSWKDGRVLIIDVSGNTQEGKLKVLAKEVENLRGLKGYYTDAPKNSALRVIHVQNASWATRFLLGKFNINDDDLTGTTFGRWARFERPQRRAGKPILNGKSFAISRDPWRGVSRTGFGLDYLRQYHHDDQNEDQYIQTNKGNQENADKQANAEAQIDQDRNSEDLKFMELNHYNESGLPAYTYNVYVQRLSVYIQFKDPTIPIDPEMKNPYDHSKQDAYGHLHSDPGRYAHGDAAFKEFHGPKLENLDSGNTIIVFEHSQTGSVQDTLIGARGSIETRWRRLSFYLSQDTTSNVNRLAFGCMGMVLDDIFSALAYSWERYVSRCEAHVGILQDKIYENPADESRAPELWRDSNSWLKVEKLMYVHIDVVKEVKSHLYEMCHNDQLEEKEQIVWLKNALDELDKQAHLIEEDLVKPTGNLSDLMYKSVGIRDSRHSLKLGDSMWRLSWITFIFLPLTFMVGFFGMNVDIFNNDPSYKWYFVAAIVMFVIVFVLWYFVKRSLTNQSVEPIRGGGYEDMFSELTREYPNLWSRSGPRPHVRPRRFMGRLKWRIIQFWYNPSRRKPSMDLEPWARTKRWLVLRWMSQISSSLSLEELSPAERGEAGVQPGVMAALLGAATPLAFVEAGPAAVPLSLLSAKRSRARSPSPTPRRSGSPDGRRSEERQASPSGGSGFMVEEAVPQGDGQASMATVSRERSNTLLVPGSAGGLAF